MSRGITFYLRVRILFLRKHALELDDRIDRDIIESFPLAQYAAEHWVKHAQFENVASRAKDGMECLFDADKPHFAAWLWIYRPHSDFSMSTKCPKRPEVVSLYYAALLGFRDLTEHLLAEHLEDVHVKGGHKVTPLHASVGRGHTDVFSLLVEHFPDLDIQDLWNQTPLHRASYGGHLEIGQRLLDRDADINAEEFDGRTPLYIAARNGQLEFARMLLERGAAINTPCEDGRAALHVASINDHVEVVRLLLENGADLFARDDDGLTPFDIASSYGWEETVQLLSEYRAKSVK
jgi:ankyrin repeat protein